MAENEKPTRGLASIGIKFYFGDATTPIWYLTNIGVLKKGKREKLDGSCFDDLRPAYVEGRYEDLEDYEIQFLYNAKEENSDYRRLAEKEDAGKPIPIVVEMPDGVKFSNSGTPHLSINDTGVNSLIMCTCEFELKGEWTKTYPTS